MKVIRQMTVWNGSHDSFSSHLLISYLHTPVLFLPREVHRPLLRIEIPTEHGGDTTIGNFLDCSRNRYYFFDHDKMKRVNDYRDNISLTWFLQAYQQILNPSLCAPHRWSEFGQTRSSMKWDIAVESATRYNLPDSTEGKGSLNWMPSHSAHRLSRAHANNRRLGWIPESTRYCRRARDRHLGGLVWRRSGRQSSSFNLFAQAQG